MSVTIKNIARPFYLGIYQLLHKTLRFNPFFPKYFNGSKIISGHIRIEQETDPKLDEEIISELNAQGLSCLHHKIDLDKFRSYLNENNYPANYYGKNNIREWEFIEKTLEHFVSLQFFQLNDESVMIDIGAGNSPFSAIIEKKFGTKFSYKQDLQLGSNDIENGISCLSSQLPFPCDSVDGLTLHCSLEHFEGDEDIAFFKEATRVLKKGGKCIVLPLYLSSAYTIHLDPVMNALKSYKPLISKNEKAAFRYCDSKQSFTRHYNVQHLKSRIIDQFPEFKTEIYRVKNFKEVDKDCYLRFMAVFTKQ